MRLIELHPKWLVGKGRKGLGVAFDCPHCVTKKDPKPERVRILFANPLDSGPVNGRKMLWRRVGESFDTLTLAPSINAEHHWHGYIIEGDIKGGLLQESPKKKCCK